MADFCRGCAEEIFGLSKDGLFSDDLAGITKPEDWAEGRAACVICEGCGPIQVDPVGNCVSADYIEMGKEGHGLPWVVQDTPIEGNSVLTPVVN